MDWVAYTQMFISHSSGGWKSKMKVLGWFGSGEDCLPAAFHCVLIWQRESPGQVSLPILIRGPVLLDQDSTLMTSFNLNLLKSPISNTISWRGWGFNTWIWAWHSSLQSRWIGQTIYSWCMFSIWLQVWCKQSRRKGVVLWAFFPKSHLFSALLLQLMWNIMTSYPDVNLVSHWWSW